MSLWEYLLAICLVEAVAEGLWVLWHLVDFEGNKLRLQSTPREDLSPQDPQQVADHAHPRVNDAADRGDLQSHAWHNPDPPLWDRHLLN